MGTRRTPLVWRGLWLFVAVLAAGVVPLAHDLERTTVHLRIAADGSFALRLAHDPSWLLLRMETFAGGNGVSTSDPAARDERLRALAPQIIDRVVLFVDGHEVRPQSAEYTPPPAGVPAGEFALASYTLRGRLPAASRGLRWYYGLVADPYPLTVELSDGTSTTETVQGDAWSTAIALGGSFARPPLLTRLRESVALGFTHVLTKGLAHALFIIGLLLVAATWRRVLAQAIAFAIAHSIALGLSFYGLITLPPHVVAPLVALSIVYIAVENLLARTLTPGRIALVFLFGLVHGIELAGGLMSMKLARTDFPIALLGFNAGVELGLIAVIAAVALLTGWCRGRGWYHTRVVVPASLAIAIVGAYSAVMRVVAGL